MLLQKLLNENRRVCRGILEIHNCKWHQDQIRAVRVCRAVLLVTASASASAPPRSL